jgi:hypothetical protein
VTPTQSGLDARYQHLSPQMVLLDPAGVVVLKSSRWRRFWLFFASLLLAAAGLVVIGSDQGLFWSVAGVVMVALGAAGFVVELVRPDALTLGRDAFSYTSLGRRITLNWAHVAEFGVLRLRARGGSVKHVGFRRATPRKGVFRRMVSGLADNFDGALPDSYGLPVEDLVVLMEEWRLAAAQRSSGVL